MIFNVGCQTKRDINQVQPQPRAYTLMLSRHCLQPSNHETENRFVNPENATAAKLPSRSTHRPSCMVPTVPSGRFCHSTVLPLYSQHPMRLGNPPSMLVPATLPPTPPVPTPSIPPDRPPHLPRKNGVTGYSYAHVSRHKPPNRPFTSSAPRPAFFSASPLTYCCNLVTQQDNVVYCCTTVRATLLQHSSPIRQSRRASTVVERQQ